MHELYGKFALSLCGRNTYWQQWSVRCLHSFKICCPSVYCSLHSRCRTGKGDWQERKKRDASFTLRVGLFKGKGKGFCMSVLTPCLLFISQIIVVAKKYIYVSQLFISRMPKIRAIPQLVSAPLNPTPIAEHFRRSHPPCEHSRGQHI